MPSCCIRPRSSRCAQCSTNFPSLTRSITIAFTINCFPVEGMCQEVHDLDVFHEQSIE